MCLVDFGLRFNHKGRHYFKAANGEDIALSLSIGAAMFNGHPDYERLIQIADEALYIAKDEVETVLNSVKPVFRCARMQR
ncbi:hypothetical protein AVR69_08830 [Escherichia coli]|uniref:GGDEF domain-containing protein n=4 Tax=Escherichia coli TaxID=562 RepID=A0AA36P6J9_ECOLX|nr:hypothetical protein P423_08250 [Escherichia coli JJ1886]AJO83479.1 hypothetical protein SY51_08620 [Escherichia coli]AMQ51173.1 hypothetical protein AX202_08510 [Escherichia coli JJ1887]ANK01474.1 Sensory transduction protein kinase [Escherichia coli O25b:H4]EGI17638.1 diguanylate cyclase YddV (DGC) [Escherichia coli M605]ETE28809.1 hypothetical protein V412_19045 [Escherichia coli LAU-EC7]KKK02602.1 hypothetical protein CR63_07245 [Escherichia coli NB8]OJH21592.1 hypothetical protein EC